MPCSLRDLKRILEKNGIEVTTPKKGSHWKAKGPGGTYSIPAHNGARTELSDIYIKGVCRYHGLDETEVFKALRKRKKGR